MEIGIGCDGCNFFWFGLHQEWEYHWKKHKCKNKRLRSTRPFIIDSCEAVLLKSACLQFTRNKLQDLPLHIVSKSQSYAGSLLAKRIRTETFGTTTTAIDILVNGPRALFLALANLADACQAISILSEVTLVSVHAAISIASVPHFGVNGLVTHLIKNARVNAAVAILHRRPEAMCDAAMEAWITSSPHPLHEYLRRFTLRRNSACDAAVACALNGNLHQLVQVLRFGPLSMWEVHRVASAAACAKPPSTAAAMVYVLKASTQMSLEFVTTIAAAAGNAAAALICIDDVTKSRSLLNSAAIRAAYNHYDTAAEILSPPQPNNRLVVTYISRCNKTDFIWQPLYTRAHKSGAECLWPLISATPQQLIAAVYAVGHRIDGVHAFLLRTKFKNSQTTLAARRIVTGIDATEFELAAAASIGLTRCGAASVKNGRTQSTMISNLLQRKMKDNAPLAMKAAIMTMAMGFNRVSKSPLSPNLCVTIAIMAI